MIDTAVLKNECLTDPTGLGLTAPFQAGADNAVAILLNTPHSSIQIKRSDIAPSEVFHALDMADLISNPGAATIAYLQALLDAPFNLRLLNDDGTNTPVQTNVVNLLKSGASATKTRLLALQTRAGSRGEQLFGANTIVTATDVAAARNL